MSGDPTKVHIWDRIEAYKALIAEPTIPADGATDLAALSWGLLGLMDPEGFEESVSSKSTDVFEYSGNLIRSVSTDFVLQHSFTCLEQNEIVRGVAWPGSTDEVIVVPKHAPFPLALEFYDGTHRERRITKVGAQVTAIAPAKKTRTGVDSVKVTVKILAAANGELFTRQIGTVAE